MPKRVKIKVLIINKIQKQQITMIIKKKKNIVFREVSYTRMYKLGNLSYISRKETGLSRFKGK